MRQSEVPDQFQKKKKQEYRDKKQAKIISVMPYIPEPPRIDDDPRVQLFSNLWKAVQKHDFTSERGFFGDPVDVFECILDSRCINSFLGHFQFRTKAEVHKILDPTKNELKAWITEDTQEATRSEQNQPCFI
ncbi:hypothetical protein BDC45DRAFT_541146 [Circinella umbellata]|nr:hypothetical protein BDC45DRAFT_541146 [Circinella umbellata]